MRCLHVVASLTLLAVTGIPESRGNEVWTGFVTPEDRIGSTLVFDSVSNQLVLFGGYDGIKWYNDVWVLSQVGTARWIELEPLGDAPAGRYRHTATFDPVGHRMIIFAGTSGSINLDDVWSLSLEGPPTWESLDPAGLQPPGRRDHSAIFDPVGQQVVVFGGFRSPEEVLHDMWTLTLSGPLSWFHFSYTAASPPSRFGHSAVYDSQRHKMVLFGGEPDASLMEFSLVSPVAWAPIQIPGLNTPSSRRDHSAAYDPVTDSMFIFGGWNGNILSDLWTVQMNGQSPWQQLSAGAIAPDPRFNHASAYDVSRRQMILFGGSAPEPRGDTWAFWTAARAWTPLAAPMPAPGGRMEHSMILDADGDRLIVFAGRDSLMFGDLWSLDLQSMAGWTVLPATGSPPPPRSGHSAIYDPLRKRMIIFGGYMEGYLNDTWAVSLDGPSSWAEIVPEGSPPPERYGHSAIYDPLRDRMLIFGGAVDNVSMGDVWELSLGENPAWSQLPAQNSGSMDRAGHEAIYDPLADRMIIFGGSNGFYLDGVWELPLTGPPIWNELAIQGQAPQARGGHVAIYDPGYHRMLIIEGFGGLYFHDMWSLSLSDPLTWSLLSPEGFLPPARTHPAAVYDPARERVVMFGGQNTQDGFLDDCWILSVPVTVGVQEHPPVSQDLLLHHAAHPNPALDSAVIGFELAEATAVKIQVFDTSGRLVGTIYEAPLVPPGRHEARWSGKDRSGRRLPPGMYVYRLDTAGGHAAGKIVLLP